MTGGGRVGVVLAATVLALTAACGAGDRACATPDVRTVPGWAAHLAAHPGDMAYLVDDGRGTRVEHRADEVMPLASASKALNLVAYARAVALGAVEPEEPVRVGDWERWSVTGTEDAHVQALDHLGIPRVGARAADPQRTVTLDQVAEVMMIFSDDASPDLLRHRLGDRALVDAARAVGWATPDLPSTTGFLVSYYTPELVPPASDRAARRGVEWDVARRYAFDPAFRADVDSRPGSGPETPWALGSPGGTARDLASLWSAVGRGTFPGADRARALAEQGPSTLPGVLARGVKGGFLAGVLTRGLEVRRADGTVGVAVVLVRGLSEDDTAAVGASSEPFDDLVFAAAQEPRLLPCRP